MHRTRVVALVALVAAIVGFVFATYSTQDYAAHLDRQVHSVHCSFVPGASVSDDAQSACKTALFSPYSAILRTAYWGGIPISLFAMGAFGFFAGLTTLIAIARQPPRWSLALLGASSLGPLAASIIMFAISATRLHTFCKLCVGIYVCSATIAAAGIIALLRLRKTKGPSPIGGLLLGLFVLAACTVAPAVVYASSAPDMKPYILSCGSITVKEEAHGALLKIPTAHPKKAVLLFEDPLCPTCKGFHQRLVTEGMLENLDITLALFPLDSECNWMLDRPLHPGACIVSKAILCAKDRAREVLEWSFENQDELRDLGKKAPKSLIGRITGVFGAPVGSCIDDRATTVRLNQHLHFASQNKIPVSTPQMFLGEKRICEEDTDLGLAWTMTQLAPEVMP
jgi:uncharacterized membrane protein